MLDYLLHLSPWLLGCFAIGACAGLLSRRAPARSRLARWLVWSSLAFLLGLIAAGLGALRGEAGAVLESGLAAFASFILGAASAAFAAYHGWRRHEGWALGLLPAALIWLVSAYVALPAYERELQRRALALAVKAGEDATGMSVEGRDLTPTKPISTNPELMQALLNMPGLRKLLDPAAEGEAAAEREASRVSQAPVRRPSEPAAVLAALPAGNLGLSDCAAALTATTAIDPITFREKSAIIRRDAALALDKAAIIIRRCPDVAVEVIGRADAVGSEAENSELSLRRAEAAARYLRREGVADRPLIVVGCGAARPLAPNTDDAGRAQNRSISFSIKPTM